MANSVILYKRNDNLVNNLSERIKWEDTHLYTFLYKLGMFSLLRHSWEQWEPRPGREKKERVRD